MIVKAEVMAVGDNLRFVVTSLEAPPPQHVYADLYCARGNCENNIKAVKCDLHSDRTSATTFLANAVRLLRACAAYVLHHALRTHTLAHTALTTAQPSTVIPASATNPLPVLIRMALALTSAWLKTTLFAFLATIRFFRNVGL